MAETNAGNGVPSGETMMRTFLLIPLLFSMCGCTTVKLPPIPGHHWRRAPFGAELYADDGHESASFVGSGLGDAAQVCPFDFDSESCHYFETNEQALNWLQHLYIAEKK